MTRICATNPICSKERTRRYKVEPEGKRIKGEVIKQAAFATDKTIAELAAERGIDEKTALSHLRKQDMALQWVVLAPPKLRKKSKRWPNSKVGSEFVTQRGEETRRKIIKVITDNPLFSTAQIAAEIGITEVAINQHLKRLGAKKVWLPMQPISSAS